LSFISPTPASDRADTRQDWPGAALFAAGLLCFMVGLTEASSLGWGSFVIVGLLLLAAALLAAWVLVELRVPAPMVDMRSLARPELLFSNVTTVFLGMCIFGLSVLVPALAQTPKLLPGGVTGGFGVGVTHVGLYFLANSLAMIAASTFVGVVGRRDNLRLLLSAGMLSSAVSCCGIAVWHSQPWQVIILLTFFGIGNGLGLATLPRMVMAAVPSTETGVATGVNMVARMTGGVIGAQAVAAILSSRVVAGTSYTSSAGFALSFWFLTALSITGAGTALLARARKPAAMRAALGEVG
jgi:MFS family permease